MPRRSPKLLIGALLVLVLVGGAALAWVFLRPAAGSGQLLAVTSDGVLHTVEATPRELGTQVVALEYAYPAISTDGRTLAYISRDGDTSSVWRVNVGSGERQELHRSTIDRPFDLAFSPDGKHLSYLSAGATGINMLLMPTDGTKPPELVTNGRNVYFTWNADSSALLTHLNGHVLEGGRVSMFAPDGGSTTPLTAAPGFFQTPAWSHDGEQVLYVAQPPFATGQPTYDEITATLVLADRQGTTVAELAREEHAALRMIRSPVNDTVAYMIERFAFDGSRSLDGLRLAEQGRAPRVLSQPDEPVTAFFWSPDGAHIAYLTYSGDYNPIGERSWRIVNLASGDVSTYAPFRPAPAYNELQIFFDAYLHGFSPWSPDGRTLAYASADGGIYTIALGEPEPTRVTDGTLALWAR